MKKNKLVLYIRWILLALFLILISTQAYLHQVLGTYKAASIHALCPYGGLESLYNLLVSGTFIKKIFTGTMVLFTITVLIALIFRRSFCGLLCPFGALQEFSAKIGQKIFKRKFMLPPKVDKPLRYLKYLVLILTGFFAWIAADLWVAPYDPWSAYAHLSEGLSAVWAESAGGLLILALTLIGSMLYDRFFCKYLCPMGALYGIIGKISPFRIERNKDKCSSCGICTKKCPVNIDVANASKITNAECINCQTCVLSCPKDGALEIKEGKKILKPSVVISLVIVLFFGSIFVSQALGIYQLTEKPVEQGQLVETAGSVNTADIKGSMTLNELAKGLGIDIKQLYEILQLPDNIPSKIKLKEIQNYIEGFTPETIREILDQK